MGAPPIARWFLQGVVILALLLVLVSLTLFAANFLYRTKAENLLRDIQTLRLEESTTKDVERIMSRDGGGPSPSSYASFCAPMSGAYDVWIGGRTIYWLELTLPTLRRLGPRPWVSSATVVLREGRVCYLHYGIGMEDPNGQWQWAVETSLLPEEQILGLDREHPSFKASTRDFKGARRLTGELSREATEEERRIAFTYDFSCVTRFRGCQGRCEIAPLLWKAVYQKSLNSGWAMPPEETNDPHCKVAEQAH